MLVLFANDFVLFYHGTGSCSSWEAGPGFPAHRPSIESCDGWAVPDDVLAGHCRRDLSGFYRPLAYVNELRQARVDLGIANL